MFSILMLVKFLKTFLLICVEYKPTANKYSMPQKEYIFTLLVDDLTFNILYFTDLGQQAYLRYLYLKTTVYLSLQLKCLLFSSVVNIFVL